MAHQHARSSSGSYGASIAPIVHHDQYYLRGGDVTFLAENYLFRVHRYFFERESPFFQQKLCTPASPGSVAIGTSDQNAFTLDSVKASDFARFLWVFYNPKYSLYEASLDDWVAILRLAHQWQFREVKALVIRELEKMAIDHVPKVVIYHTHDIDRKYLFHSYAALCAREQPLSLSEGKELGLETVLMIMRARECARGKSDGGIRSPISSNLDPIEMQSLVCEIFQIPPAESDLTVTTTAAAVPPPPPSKNGSQPPPAAASQANGTAATTTTTNGAAANKGANGVNGTNNANGIKANGDAASNGTGDAKGAVGLGLSSLHSETKNPLSSLANNGRTQSPGPNNRPGTPISLNTSGANQSLSAAAKILGDGTGASTPTRANGDEQGKNGKGSKKGGVKS